MFYFNWKCKTYGTQIKQRSDVVLVSGLAWFVTSTVVDPHMSKSQTLNRQFVGKDEWSLLFLPQKKNDPWLHPPEPLSQ